MRRRWMLAGAVMCLMAGIVFAKPGVIVTSDGRRLEGDISERDEQYVITIRGIETTVAKTNVASVNYPEAYATEFHDRLTKLPATDVAGRIEMARDAFNRRQYGLAREALDGALKIDPNNREASDLQNTIASQMRLEQNKAGGADTRTLPNPPPSANGVERRLL